MDFFARSYISTFWYHTRNVHCKTPTSLEPLVKKRIVGWLIFYAALPNDVDGVVVVGFVVVVDGTRVVVVVGHGCAVGHVGGGGQDGGGGGGGQPREAEERSSDNLSTKEVTILSTILVICILSCIPYTICQLLTLFGPSAQASR